MSSAFSFFLLLVLRLGGFVSALVITLILHLVPFLPLKTF